MTALPTREFCEKMMKEEKALFFRAESKEDFVLFQRALFAMGYGWSIGGQEVNYTHEWDRKALVLEDGEILKCDFDYSARNLVHWDASMPKKDVSLPKIINGGGAAAFHPTSEEEAREIQKRLFALGCEWLSGHKEPILLDSLPKGTLYVDNHTITFSEERESRRTVYAAAELGVGVPAIGSFQQAARKPLSVEERLAQLEERVAALEEENAKLKDQLNPEKIEKVAYLPNRNSASGEIGGP